MLKSLCSEYALRAEPSADGTGWVGIYEMPGKDSQYCRDENNRAVAIFDSGNDALVQAGYDLIEALNSRVTYRRKRHYEHMSGADFATTLKTLDISPAEFARIFGTTQERVLKEWIDCVPLRNGQPATVPHPARVLLELFSDTAEIDTGDERLGITVGWRNLHRAKSVTDGVTS